MTRRNRKPPPPPHNCPGCQKPGIPHHMLACGECWHKLPRALRDKITAGGDARLFNVSVALTWYRQNRQDTP